MFSVKAKVKGQAINLLVVKVQVLFINCMPRLILLEYHCKLQNITSINLSNLLRQDGTKRHSLYKGASQDTKHNAGKVQLQLQNKHKNTMTKESTAIITKKNKQKHLQ